MSATLSADANEALAELGLQAEDLTPEAIARVEAALVAKPRPKPDPAEMAAGIPRY